MDVFQQKKPIALKALKFLVKYYPQNLITYVTKASICQFISYIQADSNNKSVEDL